MFRGSFPGTIDEKGRLKIPRDFRVLIEEKFGRELFVTSLDGQSARIYPMPVWTEREQRLSTADVPRPSAVRRFFQRVNYYGQSTEIDNQGRVLIHQRLRESADMTGEVDVVGNVDFLEVWNHARMVANLERDGFTAEDEDALLKRT